MKITSKIGYLGLLIMLASLDTTMAEAKVAKTPQTISERVAKIQQKLQENRQRLEMTNWGNTDPELLTFFGDFGDSPLFGDFGDAPIFSPFGDFGDSPLFGDFGDLW